MCEIRLSNLEFAGFSSELNELFTGKWRGRIKMAAHLLAGVRMRTVLQGRDEYGCGAACLAMLAGITYIQARHEIFGDQIPGSPGVSKRMLIEHFREHGFTTGATGRLSKNFAVTHLTHNALLGGYLIQDKDYKHWLVWDAREQVVRDPYGYRAPCRLTSYTVIARR
jgi:hypothetical protein